MVMELEEITHVLIDGLVSLKRVLGFETTFNLFGILCIPLLKD